jgi:hypothetical protein
MRKHISTASLTAGLLASGSLYAQVANPIPEPVTTQGLEVRIENFARLPGTRALDPAIGGAPVGWAKPSYVRDLADGRRFVNDSRGFLYQLGSNNKPALYLNYRNVFPLLSFDGLQSGFVGFEFHPEFSENGLFYTSHLEEIAGNTGTLDFIPPGFTQDDVTFHDVITAWQASDPSASVFQGTHRQLLRVGHITDNPYHVLGGHLAFNPTSEPGDADYGLLYIGSTDLGFSNGGGPHAGAPDQTQRLDTLLTAILRVDPRSPSESEGTKGVGDYTIPEINHYAADGDPNTFGEIYAHGFRNPHRFSWDMSDGTLFAMDIGMSQIEEINIVHEGRNYGWFQREGYFDNGIHYPNGTMDVVFPLPADILDGSTPDEFTYPVAVYDHDEGVAITNGFAYRGAIPALQGKFVFGDIRQGRLFAVDVAELKAADDGIPQTVAPIEEIQLYVTDASGQRENVSLHDLIERELGRRTARADLHLSEGRDGEIFVTSRQDGFIRILVPD